MYTLYMSCVFLPLWFHISVNFLYYSPVNNLYDFGYRKFKARKRKFERFNYFTISPGASLLHLLLLLKIIL